MKRVFLTLCTLSLAVILTTSAAQARPDTRKMSCRDAQNLVLRSGGIVLTTGQRTYERYVIGRRFCAAYETIRKRWVPTTDNKRCFIGFSCEAPYSPDYDEFGLDLFD